MEQICQSYHMGLEAIQNLFTEEHLKSTIYIQQLEAENKQLQETVASLQMAVKKHHEKFKGKNRTEIWWANRAQRL